MPDVKISALPTASIVGLSDIFVLNQGGVTKTASKSLVIAGLATTNQIGGLNSAQVQALASAQIAAITPASIGAFATSAIIGIGNGGTGSTSAASALAALGGITSAQVPALDSAQLSAYVLKAGSTMEGRLIMAATTDQAKANIGGFLTGAAAPASIIPGDVWVSNQSKLSFSPSTGVTVNVAGLSQANTFNQTQTIGVGGTVTSLAVSNNGTGRAATFAAASASAAVSILQTGVGEAFRVEDETSPDATPFVISGTGRVGIGVTPDAVTALSVDAGGIKFSDGSIATTALGGLNSAQVQSLTSSQIAAITPASIGALSTAAASGFATTGQLSGFATTTDIQGIAFTSQLSAFTNSAQVQSLASAQIAAITPGSIGAVATSAIIAIIHGGTGSTDAISALSALGAAGLESPAFTGTPTAPTAAANTNTTQLATTEFVISNRGDSYLTTSTSPQTIGNGTKTFTVEAGLSYTPTQDVTIVYDASNHMHGLVVTYSGTTLVVDITQHTGAGSYSLWTLNVGGLTTAAGALLSANNLSDVANTATSLTNLGGVSTARSVSAGTGLTGGGDLTASRTLSIAALSPDPTGTYGSTSQIPSLTVNNLGQVTAASSLAMPTTNVQVFTSDGTWTKPAGAKLVIFDVVAAGGGGGAGGKAASGTAIFGGGGGGGGGYTSLTYAATDLADASYAVVVGTGGTGGIFSPLTSATAGGISTITGGTQGLIVRASGGGAAGSGTTTTGAAGIAGTYTTNTGGASNTAGTAGGGSGGVRGPASGAAGGGCSTSAPYNGGIGGSNVPYGLAGGSGGGQSTSANGGTGGNGNLKTGLASALFIGSGGGGGGASTFATGSGGNGGNGTGTGCGGGGGGATHGSGNGGNGGNGAPGIVVVTTYF